MTVLMLILGLCTGSFLNVVIYRVPKGLSIVSPGSMCPSCGEPIKRRDNIPVLSFILLKGKCRSCGTGIPFTYPAVEIINMLLWGFAASFNMPQMLIGALISSVLLAVFIIDARHMIIPDSLIVSILIVAAIDIIFGDVSEIGNRIKGFIAGGGIMMLISFASKVIISKDGMGGGDIKLMAACGIILGWRNILFSLFVSSVLLLVAEGLKYFTGKKIKLRNEIPFGPALATGVLICYYYGDQIIRLYIDMIIKTK